MIPRLSLLMASGVAASALWANTLTAATQQEQVAEILTPKDRANVARLEDFQGRLTKKGRGWPVVLVRPLIDEEPWYVQPEVSMASGGGLFTTRLFLGDTRTPPGTQFRILILVAPSREEAQRKFKRGAAMRNLPPGLKTSEPVTVFRNGITRRKPPTKAKPRSIKFAGRTWEVKSGRSMGPGPNHFSDAEENVWVDKKNGHLHLAITKRDDGRWHCAEVVGPSLGHGEYRWVISGNFPKLDPKVVLGLFVYRARDRNRDAAEIDFELARWGDPDKANCQFVVQPHGPDSMHRFDSAKAEVLTCSLLWHKGEVRGRCWVGEDISKKPLADWKYTGPKVPRPGGERVRANLWLFEGQPPTAKARQEVVIRSFHFQPAGQEEPAVAQILAPKDGPVTPLEDFRGRLMKKDGGWPVVVVRPLIDEFWYVQPEVSNVTTSGLFTTRLFIGDSGTPPGTKFRILILVAPSREEAYRKFKRGTTMRNLPADLPTSEPVTVSRN